MASEFFMALELLEKEKGIKKEFMLESLETALVHTYKKNYKEASDEVEVKISEKGDVTVVVTKLVVDHIDEESPENAILLEDALKLKSTAKVGKKIKISTKPKDFGRIAAQTAKQMILQKLREAEREQILTEYRIQPNEMLTGKIERFEKIEPRKDKENLKKNEPTKYNVIMTIGKAEAILGPTAQVASETYRLQDNMKVIVIDVKNTPRGPYIMVSRSSSELVRKLFEREVPEIKDGIVEIKNLVREAGSRTKMAVWSNDEDVDPVGSCVGNRGARVNAIVDELRGEKIDIVKYSDDPAEIITAALAPAKVVSVDISEKYYTEGKKEATIVVADSQLSLAIGKEGQNARLAAKLTGWKIDIKSDKV